MSSLPATATPETLTTTLRVDYPAAQGSIALCGDLAPLSWTAALAPARREGDSTWVFELDLPEGAIVEWKPVRNGSDWACGRNYTTLAGDTVTVAPYFDRATGHFEGSLDGHTGGDIHTLPSTELSRDLRFRVFLPPSYHERLDKRYPVLYAQDGQNLFHDTVDPFDGHSWRLDDALNELYDLGAIEEIIVVGVYTDHGRLEMLSPLVDKRHGGGDGPLYRAFLENTLKPAIDKTYRTLPKCEDTAIMGSSMGGLFSFFAAWSRPRVFGKAACLSSSFWWSERAMVREVQGGSCPFPSPLLYLDSGAAKSQFEEDANLRDGYHHTMAMHNALVNHCYEPGKNLHTLAFAGLSHNNAAWASRVGIPLQLLFPRRA